MGDMQVDFDASLSYSKQALSSPAVLNRLDASCRAVMGSLVGAIPQVCLQWFKDHLLPGLRSEINVQALVNNLKMSRDIAESGHWTKCSAMATRAPPIEDLMFKPFEEVAQVVRITAANLLPDVEPSVVFKCNPAMVPIPSLRTTTSKPDVLGLLTKHAGYRTDGSISWEVIAVPGETRVDDAWHAVNDNNRKMMCTLKQIMKEDVCRRFVIGYTIEKTNMRLWFCSRSDILVSEPFDFTLDHHTLTHFLVSLMYAGPEELGYDPTIKPACDPMARAKNQYDITVRQPNGGLSKYRTIRMISDVGAESVRSKGTRVWEARRLYEGRPQGDTVVLKDCWVDDDREREAVILAKIVESATTAKDKEILNKHLLTVLAYGDVYINGEKDQTHALLRRGGSIPTDLPAYELELRPPSPNAIALTGGAPVLPEETRTPQVFDYSVKAHHRIVFREVGTSVEKLTSVCDVVKMLLQVLRGLQAVHQSGWVHRDVSMGNILMVNGVAKITDLEYAKRMSDNSDHTLRMGTAYYMAVELDDYDYEFISDDSDNSTIKMSDMTREVECQSTTVESSHSNHSPRIPKLPPFRHNPLHDSEGVWWLAVRLLLDRDNVTVGPLTAEELTRARKQRRFYHELFQNPIARRKAFLSSYKFTAGEAFVHPSMLHVAQQLEKARARLVVAYQNAERDVTKIDHTVGRKAAYGMMDAFVNIAEVYLRDDVQLQPMRSPMAKKDTPETPGVVIPGHSIDSRQVPPNLKRRRDAAYVYVGVDHIPAKVEAVALEPIDEGRAIKRAKRPQKVIVPFRELAGNVDIHNRGDKSVRMSVRKAGVSEPPVLRRSLRLVEKKNKSKTA